MPSSSAMSAIASRSGCRTPLRWDAARRPGRGPSSRIGQPPAQRRGEVLDVLEAQQRRALDSEWGAARSQSARGPTRPRGGARAVLGGTEQPQRRRRIDRRIRGPTVRSRRGRASRPRDPARRTSSSGVAPTRPSQEKVKQLGKCSASRRVSERSSSTAPTTPRGPGRGRPCRARRGGSPGWRSPPRRASGPRGRSHPRSGSGPGRVAACTGAHLGGLPRHRPPPHRVTLLHGGREPGPSAGPRGASRGR
jgi:hypothetical protein